MTNPIDVSQLKEQQRQFLETICYRLQQRPCLYHPQMHRSYSVPKQPKFVWRNAQPAIAGLPGKPAIYPQQIPSNRTLELAISTGGLLTKRRSNLYIIASFWAPLAECLQSGHASLPLSLVELQKWIGGLGITPPDFFYVVLCCPTGWEEQVAHHLPGGENLAVLLMCPDGESWHLLHDERDFWLKVLPLFDPQTEEQKVTLVSRYLQSSPRLRVRGGYLIVANIAREFGLSEAVIEKAVAELIKVDRQLIREKPDGIAIIKRRRF